MADESKKTLEMRVAELEDKLSKIHITEDEMKAFHKVSSLLGTSTTAASQCIAARGISSCIAAHSPYIAGGGGSVAAGCIASDCLNCNCVSPCWTECRACVIVQCHVRQCAIFQPGGTFGGGGGISGGGFGSLGG